MKTSFSLILLFLATVAFAEKQPYERYQSIVDRQPFGQPPPGFNPEQMASEVSRSGSADDAPVLTMDQEQIQRAVSFSVINVESEDCIMVGFSDRSDAKAPRHYYLQVGETQDGWTVKDCDPVKESMTIVKDGIEVPMQLGVNSGSGSAASAGPATRGPQPRAAGAPNNRVNLLARAAGAGGASGTPMSYQGRRARREQEEAKAKADAAALELERKRRQEEMEAKAAA